jgi:hypothetical protein
MLAYDERVHATGIVLDACLDRYRRLGVAAEPLEWDRVDLHGPEVRTATVVRTERRLDWILTADTPLGDHVPLFERLVAEGWTVHALVPIETLGGAHRALRGCPIRLQGWWTDGGGVHFGRPEIP